MIQKYRTKRKLFGWLTLAAAAVSLVLAAFGLNTAGCIVFAAAFFAFAMPFVHYHEKLRRMPAESYDDDSGFDRPMIFIAPLSAGLSKSQLYYVPMADCCVIRHPNGDHQQTVTVREAAEMLCEKKNYYGVFRLGKAADADFTDLVNRHSRGFRVEQMEALRLPVEGEVRKRQDSLGLLTEVYANGAWVPDAAQCIVADGMEDHFAAYRIAQAKLADEPKPPRPDRARFDRSLNRYRWTTPLEDSRTYFLTMYFGSDKKFLDYSLDVEKANDSHYKFTLDGEDMIRPLLAGPDAVQSRYTVPLHELMTAFLKYSSGATLETMVQKICTEEYHF